MKRLFVSLIALLAVSSSTQIYGQGVAYKMNVPYVLPQTTVSVKLVVEQEVVKKGPYAKYAQQYLGVAAPLTDKVNYKVIGAGLSSFNEADPSNILILDDPAQSGLTMQAAESQKENPSQVVIPSEVTGVNDVIFSDLGINPIVYIPTSALTADRRSAREKTTEELASDAASTIFTLRKRRFDLVTGEAGENVFGAGLQAALDEMKRIEDEYVSLFVGKKSVVRTVTQYDMVPEKGKTNMVVCRFSPQKGVVDLNDMTGEPIVLMLNPEGTVKSYVGDPKKGVKGMVAYRVADMVQCKLFDGQNLLTVKRLPIYQFGTIVEAMMPTK